MSRIGWIISGVIFLLTSLALLAKIIKDNITFSVSLKNISVIQMGNNPRIRIDLLISIINKNVFGLTISSLYYEIFYKGKLLAKSAENTINNPIIILPDGIPYSSEQSVEVSINTSYIDLLQNYITKVQSDFSLNLKVKVFGITIPLKDIKFSY